MGGRPQVATTSLPPFINTDEAAAGTPLFLNGPGCFYEPYAEAPKTTKGDWVGPGNVYGHPHHQPPTTHHPAPAPDPQEASPPSHVAASRPPGAKHLGPAPGPGREPGPDPEAQVPARLPGGRALGPGPRAPGLGPGPRALAPGSETRAFASLIPPVASAGHAKRKQFSAIFF